MDLTGYRDDPGGRPRAAGVAPHETGTASGLLNSSRQIGAAVGLAALAAVANHRTGQTATPEALNNGYALGLTLSATLLVVDAEAPIPFSRLVRTELRKLTDTRASRWLLAAILSQDSDTPDS